MRDRARLADLTLRALAGHPDGRLHWEPVAARRKRRCQFCLALWPPGGRHGLLTYGGIRELEALKRPSVACCSYCADAAGLMRDGAAT